MLGGGGSLGRTVEVWCVRLMCGRHGMLVLASPARDVRTHADAREAETGCCTHVRCDARSPAGDPIRSVRVADMVAWTFFFASPPRLPGCSYVASMVPARINSEFPNVLINPNQSTIQPPPCRSHLEYQKEGGTSLVTRGLICAKCSP